MAETDTILEQKLDEIIKLHKKVIQHLELLNEDRCENEEPIDPYVEAVLQQNLR